VPKAERAPLLRYTYISRLVWLCNSACTIELNSRMILGIGEGRKLSCCMKRLTEHVLWQIEENDEERVVAEGM